MFQVETRFVCELDTGMVLCSDRGIPVFYIFQVDNDTPANKLQIGKLKQNKSTIPLGDRLFQTIYTGTFLPEGGGVNNLCWFMWNHNEKDFRRIYMPQQINGFDVFETWLTKLEQKRMMTYVKV